MSHTITSQPSLLRSVFQSAVKSAGAVYLLSLRYPLKTTGLLSLVSIAPLINVGVQMGNPIMIACGVLGTVGSTALACFGDRRHEAAPAEIAFVDPQDQKIGLKRLWQPHRYPVEFAASMSSTALCGLVVSGIHVDANPSDLIQVAGVGIEGQTLTSLMCLGAQSIVILVKEKDEAQIEELRRLRAQAGESLSGLRKVAVQAFNNVADRVRRSPTFYTAAIYQASLVPFLWQGLRYSENQAAMASVVASVAGYVVANIYYGLSSKRQSAPPSAAVSPAP